MISHPYTSAQRGTWHRHTANDHTLWWDQRPRARFTDPSMEPWTEHEQPAIVRARIADGWITDKVRGEPWLSACDFTKDWARAANFGGAPKPDDGDTRIERTPVWNLLWTNDRLHQFAGDARKLLSTLLSADTRGWTLKSAKRNGEQVHIEFSERAVVVGKREPDGTIVVLDAKEFY
jgi:hypothetical protein